MERVRQTEDPSLFLSRTDRRPRNDEQPLNEVIKIVTGHAAAAYGWLGEGEGRESKREGRKFCQLQYYGSCSGALANRKPAAGEWRWEQLGVYGERDGAQMLPLSVVWPRE